MKKTAVIFSVLLLIAALVGCAGSKRVAPREDDLFGSRAYRHFLNGEMPRAIEAYKRGYASARANDNGIGAARYLSNIGRAFYELEQADSAALYFAKAYEEFKVYKDDRNAARSAAFLAICFASAGDDAPARRWLNTALSSSVSANKKEQRENEHYYAVIRGMVDFHLTSKVSNENALEAAAAFYRKNKDHSFLPAIYRLMADVEFAKGNCTVALRYLSDALLSIDESREKYRRSGTLLKMAKINFCAGDHSAGKHFYERAVDCVAKGTAVPSVEEVSSCSGNCR